MRTIKFRGKRLDNGKWAYGSLLMLNDQAQIVNNDDSPLVDPATVGQYTGYIDRAYNEIYEGDVIEYCAGVDRFGARWIDVKVEYSDEWCGYIGIQLFGHTRDRRPIVCNLLRCLDKCIVKGNIHDNPELIL